jgi:hypothetical protein
LLIPDETQWSAMAEATMVASVAAASPAANGIRRALGRVEVAGWHRAVNVHDHHHPRQRDGRRIA